MLRPIQKLQRRKNRFSVISQNLLHTIFCESTIVNYVYLSSHCGGALPQHSGRVGEHAGAPAPRDQVGVHLGGEGRCLPGVSLLLLL